MLVLALCLVVTCERRGWLR